MCHLDAAPPPVLMLTQPVPKPRLDFYGETNAINSTDARRKDGPTVYYCLHITQNAQNCQLYSYRNLSEDVDSCMYAVRV